MRRILGRLLSSVILLWAVFTLTFLLTRFAPGNPFAQGRHLPPEVMANLMKVYHLDQPLWVQYLLTLRQTLEGNLGVSYKAAGIPVSEILLQTLPVSLTLGAAALLVSVLMGLLGGLLIGIGSPILSRTLRWTTTLLVGLPSFLLAAVLIDLLALRGGFLPVALWEGWRSAVLPVIALSVAPAGYLARVFAASMEETLDSPFYRTAVAKGLDPLRRIVFHLVLPSLNAVLSLLGPLAAAFLTGSFVVETVFAIPGMGRVFFLSVMNRDYPLIMGTTLVYTVFLTVAVLLGDFLSEAVDPRVRAV
ncbi:MAG: ABC transporter permease [Nitrospiraceae bacterium]|nr:ABC transporter permease [Nitrospiraceae bacterium]